MTVKNPLNKIAWQGISADVTGEWNLVAINGDTRSGYYRAVNPDGLSLEVKWFSARKPLVLEYTVNNYLRDLERKARRKKQEFKSETKSAYGEITFSWRSKLGAKGRAWQCTECRRILIAQISGNSMSQVSPAAASILPSMCDHEAEGWQAWAMYDMMAETPPGFKLIRHKLMSGYIQLVFSKGANRLIIERWGLAETALRDSSLREWFKERSLYELKAYNWKVEEIEFEDESSGLVLKGKRGFKGMSASLRELSRLQKPAGRLTGYVWLCPQSNKIFSIQLFYSRNDSLLEEVMERVVCH